jgi:hypothetical protein
MVWVAWAVITNSCQLLLMVGWALSWGCGLVSNMWMLHVTWASSCNMAPSLKSEHFEKDRTVQRMHYFLSPSLKNDILYTWENHLVRRKVYFSSWVWSFQSMDNWPSCFWTQNVAVHHVRKMKLLTLWQSCYVVHVGLDFLGSSDPPASVSQAAGTVEMIKMIL